jgi:protein-S-isoprenylcysteine O-methyltransferase Ste14
MVRRLVLQTSAWLIFMAALLFVPAGRLDWAGGWAFLGAFAFAGFAMGFWLLRHDPALLRQRLGPLVQREQKTWDKAFMIAFLGLWHGWLILMALDAGRWRWSQMPAWLQAIGALGFALCMVLCFFTFRENSYAAPVVRIQRERGQQVVSTGPYAYVRHPMYAGALCLFLGAPLLLGSWLGFAMAPVLILLLAVRAVLEERTLAEELDGYRDYAAHVRYRFVPLVW